MPKETKVRTGDTWRLDNHVVICGRCEDYLPALKKAKADLLLTDPPYGISLIGSKNRKIGTRKTKGRLGKSKVFKSVEGDDRPFNPSHLFQLATTQALFGANYYCKDLPRPGQWIVWDKMHVPGLTFSDCELMWTNREGVAIKKYSYHWDGNRKEDPREKKIHPTQKPLQLIADLIRDLSKPRSLIVDPYLGSGTTLLAAEQLGRRCIGIEVDPIYVDWTIQRWEAMTGKKAKKG